MKKILTLLGLAAMSAMLLVGCGDPNKTPEKQPNTIGGVEVTITADQVNDAVKLVVFTDGNLNLPDGQYADFDEAVHVAYEVTNVKITYQINGAEPVEKSFDSIKIEPNHPWIGDSPDETKIANYQTALTTIFDSKLKKDDKVAIKFEGTTDLDVIQADIVDQGPANNWSWDVINDPSRIYLKGSASETNEPPVSDTPPIPDDPASPVLPATFEKEAGTGDNDYALMGKIKLSDLEVPATWTKVAIVGEVYKGDTKIDIASNWGDRILFKLVDAEGNQLSEDTNGGLADQKIDYKEGAAAIDIHRKPSAVTKIIIKEVIFE